MPNPMTLLGISRASAAAWAPTDIAGLALWLKSDAGLYQERTGAAATTPATADGDPVGTWQDQTVNARHVTAPTDAKRPTKQTVGGIVTVRFDGTDDWLYSAVFGVALTQPTTIVVVGKNDNALIGTPNMLMDGGLGATERQLIYAEAAADVWGFYAGTIQVTATAMDANVNTHAVIFNGASSRYRLNGVSISTANPGANGLESLSVGNDNGGVVPWDGDIYEVLVYSGSLSDANLNLLGNYLERHGGTAWSDI